MNASWMPRLATMVTRMGTTGEVAEEGVVEEGAIITTAAECTEDPVRTVVSSREVVEDVVEAEEEGAVAAEVAAEVAVEVAIVEGVDMAIGEEAAAVAARVIGGNHSIVGRYFLKSMVVGVVYSYYDGRRRGKPLLQQNAHNTIIKAQKIPSLLTKNPFQTSNR